MGVEWGSLIHTICGSHMDPTGHFRFNLEKISSALGISEEDLSAKEIDFDGKNDK